MPLAHLRFLPKPNIVDGPITWMLGARICGDIVPPPLRRVIPNARRTGGARPTDTLALPREPLRDVFLKPDAIILPARLAVATTRSFTGAFFSGFFFNTSFHSSLLLTGVGWCSDVFPSEYSDITFHLPFSLFLLTYVSSTNGLR